MDISRVNFRKHNKIFLFIFLFINFLVVPLHAQKGSVTVKGIVTDTSGKPVPFASVALKDLSKGTLTDEAGHFALNDVQSDENILHVQCIGYPVCKKELILILYLICMSNWLTISKNETLNKLKTSQEGLAGDEAAA